LRHRKVRLPDDIREALAKLHPEVKGKVRAAIEAIAEDPTVGVRLEDELAGFRKIAVGSWRVVYRDEVAAIRIHAVGRRATVYSELIERLRSIREGAPTRRRTGRSHRSGADTGRQPSISTASGPRPRMQRRSRRRNV
jgi:mRNA-degrading endonuclease RelE of RelBE toxin-antitoxin system